MARSAVPGDALQVTLNNVDLASVDALLLRPPQFTGRLNASATITGTTDAPQVKADFQVSKGGFRQFRYDTLRRHRRTTPARADARHQAAAEPDDVASRRRATCRWRCSTWRSARPAPHARSAVAPEDRIDLHIDSSPIDLGVVQGFTTALTNVTGTLQAKIDVTGSAGDPHPNGAVTIQNAAFTVEPTGVGYTKLRRPIDLQRDRVHIDSITVLDNHEKPLLDHRRPRDPRAAGRRRATGRQGRPTSRSSTTRWATSGSTAICSIARRAAARRASTAISA